MVEIIFLLHLFAVASSNCVSEPYKCSLAGSNVSLYCESNMHGVTPFFIGPMGEKVTTNPNEGFDLDETRGETTLTIQNALVSDSGTYGCVSGKCRESIDLVIYEDISFPHRDAESFQQLRSNYQGVISCTVSSVPAASIEWYFNGARIYDNEDRYINGTNLAIKKVTKEHTGNYTCQAVIRGCSRLDKLHIRVTVAKGHMECFRCMSYIKVGPGKHPTDTCSIISNESFLKTVPCMSSCITIVAEGLEDNDLMSQLIRRDCSDNVTLSTPNSNHTLTKMNLDEIKETVSSTAVTFHSGRVRFCAQNLCNKEDAEYQNIQTISHNNEIKQPANSSTTQLKMHNIVHFAISMLVYYVY